MLGCLYEPSASLVPAMCSAAPLQKAAENAQRDMYTVLPELAMRPADAYERLVRGRGESVELEELMGRTLAVMIVRYPPGFTLIIPGERITGAKKSIQHYLLYAREFDQKFHGFETDIHGLRFEPAAGGRRYLIDCIGAE